MAKANTNTVLLIVLIVAVVLVGGGVIYSINRSNQTTDSNSDRQITQEDSERRSNDESESTTDSSTTEDTEDTQAIDDVPVPARVVAEIENKYPDYVIDDVDQEDRNGSIYYEVELDHRTPENDSDYKLTYNENWELTGEEFDQN